ncbi:MAG: ferritin [Cyanobacteria bacterium SIG26]|nr:ferritin [Cyanobacteria bacterium SIG26]
MISDKIRDILNEQINKEFYSAYLYLSMSAYFSEIGMYGFSNWTKVQSKEEIDHGMILFEYVLGRNSQIHLGQISTPNFDMNSPLEVFEQIYQHERSITSAIDAVANMTEGECDLATRNFIDWYLNEQIEEEAAVLRIISKLKTFGSEKSALYLIDKELSQREYESPSY